MSVIRCQENILTFVSYTELPFFQNASLVCRSRLLHKYCFTFPKEIIYIGKTEMQHADLKYRNEKGEG